MIEITLMDLIKGCVAEILLPEPVDTPDCIPASPDYLLHPDKPF